MAIADEPDNQFVLSGSASLRRCRGAIAIIHLSRSYFDRSGSSASEDCGRWVEGENWGTRTYDWTELKMGLWEPVVSDARLHPSFRELRSRDSWLAARKMVEWVYERFPHPDPNFVEQFQTTGFDQRVWELALFAGLEEICSSVDRISDRPDFHCVTQPQTFFVECTTSAPTQDPGGPPPPTETPDEFLDRIREQGDIADDEVAIKLGSALYSKLKKEYDKLPHVPGHPLVLAIEALF